MKSKYTPSRHLVSFNIAGFSHYDGIDVINELGLGKNVTLAIEPDNPYDPEAVAILYEGKKLGYIPKDKNSLLSMLIFYGHGDIFEAKIERVNITSHPEQQFHVTIRVKDNR